MTQTSVSHMVCVKFLVPLYRDGTELENYSIYAQCFSFDFQENPLSLPEIWPMLLLTRKIIYGRWDKYV